jgi:phage terminase large subunit
MWMMKKMKVNVHIKKRVFNDCYYPYLNNEDRYIVFYGGGSSGKSYFIAQWLIYKMLTRKMNLLVVRQTANTNRDSTFALFKDVIHKWHMDELFKVTDLRIKCINDNEIIFRRTR